VAYETTRTLLRFFPFFLIQKHDFLRFWVVAHVFSNTACVCKKAADVESVKMLKLLSLAVILSYNCLMHVHGDCTAGQISIIQQQWADTFNTQERLRQFAQTYFERSAIKTFLVLIYTVSQKRRHYILVHIFDK